MLNLAQPCKWGDRLLQLGNFETLMITLQISDLEIGALSLGQSVTVTLDAFPDQVITGQISQISPAADPISRLVPVEILVPNQDERIGSGFVGPGCDHADIYRYDRYSHVRFGCGRNGKSGYDQ